MIHETGTIEKDLGEQTAKGKPEATPRDYLGAGTRQEAYLALVTRG